MTLTSKESVDKLHGAPFTIRKISSEDDVGGLPRSHYTPKVISVYADSIRRQRSDSFVHSYNHHHKSNNSNNHNTHQTPTATRTLSARRPIHSHMSTQDDDDNDSMDKPDPTTCDSTNDRSGFLTVNNININNNVNSSSNSSIRNSGGSYHSRASTLTATPPSLHINTSSSTTSHGKNDTGAILEGVLIRRAIRPGSHLAHQQQKATTKDDLITPSASPKDEEKETLTYSPTPITNTTTPLIQNGGIISPVSSTLDSSIPTPWQPPSLTTPHPSNLTISSMSSPPPLDDDTTIGSVVSKMLPRKDKSLDDYSKHPSLFKRLAQRHHHGPRLYRDDAMASSSPSATVIMDQNTELDRYGFQKATQWIPLDTYHDFEKYYQPTLDRRLLRWQQLLDEHESKLPDRNTQGESFGLVKRYVRKGVPSHLRGHIWFHYSGAEAKMDANPGVYEKFLKRAQEMGNENEFADLIERDLHRTFPDNIQFSKAAAKAMAAATLDTTTATKPPAIDVLRRVLSAFSVYCPSVGYCQSLNYLVGMLLLFLKEEETFWCLVTIVQTTLPAGVYDVTMEGASIDQAVLMMLLYERMPQLWYKLTDKTFWEAEADGVSMPTITLVTSHWFLTLFINILPTETVLRVWDCFFYEGSSILFRIAMTLFKMSEPIIYGLIDPLEIFQVIQNFPKRLIDCQTLMDNAFRRFGSLTDVTSEDLDRRREICRELRKARRIMTSEELVATRHKLDPPLRKRWKLAVNPSSGSRK
ncbi:hypothetical protein [Absidia glauca]|uniref:Rab-GAP TBC domain-containing protein n=1 Tax=Absidia glauca TaxID=4829 RepID=A0A168R6R8_ABSGL|nr:hypothetical protein [Absidia glauca]